ncbi:integrase catalytic subunit [Leptolyngbya sp. NIES-3755]|nr:integrase catalytic subunit [Leptolyngbya sp. NIES-3755]
MESDDLSSSKSLDDSSGDQNSSIDRTQSWQLIFEQLATASDHDAYTQQLQQAASTMRCSIRTVQRRFHNWTKGDINASQNRPSRGRNQISEELRRWVVRLYLRGNSQGNAMNPKQVFHQLQYEVLAAGGMLDEDCPSLSTVYRILNPIIEAQGQKRHPGEVQRLPFISPSFSNEIWWCNLIRLPQQVRDCFGELAGYPFLVTLHDGRSGNVMGAKLTLSGSPEEAIALALRQAILPKQVEDENAPLHRWTACGFPVHLVIDWSKNLSKLPRLCNILGIGCHREQPFGRMVGAIESFNNQMMRTLALSPERRDQQLTRLSLAELEQLIIQHIVDHYNQQNHPKDSQHTRTERWEAGLAKFPPDVPPERSLDVCLPKTGNRVVQNNGCVQFEGQTYRDSILAFHIGERVHLRYNLSNITTVLVYQQQGSEEIFLARVCIQHFHEECLSLDDARAIRHRLRQERNLD